MDKSNVGEPRSYYIPTKISMLITRRQSMSPEIDQPPPHTTMISVPFKWEESPGKPRHYHTQSDENTSVRTTTTLELPPRLLFLEAKKVAPSPTTTTVYLDHGPLLGRAMSFTTSYRTPREKWNSNFGSSRWNGFRNEEGTFDFSAHKNIGNTTRRRRRSLLSLSKAKSHFWASVYESFKQVVPWRRRRETQKKWPSKSDTV